MSEENKNKKSSSDTDLDSILYSFEDVNKINKIISNFRIFRFKKKERKLYSR